MTFRNRIVGYGVKPADQFTANPRNPKFHPEFQRQVLTALLGDIGFVMPVVEFADGYLLDGHERVWEALEANSDVPFVQIDIRSDDEEGLRALATVDPVGRLAEHDRAQLDALLRDVQSDSEYVQRMLAELRESVIGDEIKPETYSRKIDIPLYEPSGAKPKLSELYDETRTKELVEQIRSEPGLSEDDRLFLTLAAQRHTVFNFAKIADWYAHSELGVQQLMENSALVIIDFNRAIELGYIKLTSEIAAMIADENDE